MPSLSDLSHVDPCVICGDMQLRANMVTASKHFVKTGKRGYVCAGCHSSPKTFHSAFRRQAGLE